ncbi:MAG: hypothetical protein ACON5H_05680 [Akkermansiaceae bacterium]
MVETFHRPELPEVELEEFVGALGSRIEGAMLRNADVIANFRRGGDCDLLVADLEKAGEVILEIFGDPVRIARRSYLVSYFYPWGHFDLTDYYYWRGMRLMTGEQMLKTLRIEENGVPIVSEVDEALTRLFGSLLWGGFVKKIYVPEMRKVFDAERERFGDRLAEMAGSEVKDLIVPVLESENWMDLENLVREIRRGTIKHCLSERPFQTIFGQIRFYAWEVWLRLWNPIPLLILEMDDGIEENAEQLKDVGKSLDCQVEVRVVDPKKSKFALFLEVLRKASFRANNGLLILVMKHGSGGKVPFGMKAQVQEIGTFDEKGIFDRFFQYQRRTRRRNG